MTAADLYTFGLATWLVNNAKYNGMFREWVIPGYKAFLSFHYTRDIPNNLTPEKRRKYVPIYIKREYVNLGATKECWNDWSEDKELLEAIETIIMKHLYELFIALYNLHPIELNGHKYLTVREIKSLGIFDTFRKYDKKRLIHHKVKLAGFWRYPMERVFEIYIKHISY